LQNSAEFVRGDTAEEDGGLTQTSDGASHVEWPTAGHRRDRACSIDEEIDEVFTDYCNSPLAHSEFILTMD
jgi:hypothetical protein